MKIEKEFFNIALLDIIVFSLMMFVISSVVNFIRFLLFGGINQVGFFNIDSIVQIIVALLIGLLLSYINQNGGLKFSEYNDASILTKQINNLLLDKGYIAVQLQAGETKYIKKNKFVRFFKHILRKNITVKVTDNAVIIFTNRNNIYLFEKALKYSVS